METPRVKRVIFPLVCRNHAHTQRKSTLRGVGKRYRLQWGNNISSDGKSVSQEFVKYFVFQIYVPRQGLLIVFVFNVTRTRVFKILQYFFTTLFCSEKCKKRKLY